ncbi:ABC transporter permease [Paenibacillus marinisediminis]
MARLSPSQQGQRERPNVSDWIQPELLWASRVRAFWMDILPYMKYVISSGLGTLLVFGFVAGTALYASFVDRIPPGFPVQELSWIVLSPLAAYMTYRTYLVPADVAFLLRIEHRLQPYFKRAIVSSFIPRVILLLAAWCVLWPLYYRAADSAKDFLITMLFLSLVKAVAAYGAWTERHIPDKRWHMIFRLARYLWAFGAVGAWLWLSASMAGLITGAAGIVYIMACRFVPKLSFAWEAHIDAERTHVSRIHTFMSGFVDLPATDERRFARPWLNKLGDRFAFRQEHAYRYLLMKTLIRSELLGMLIRLTVIGVVLLWWTRDTEWNSLVLLLFLVAIGAQCNALFQLHRHDVWRHLYPIPSGSKHRAALQLGTELQTATAVILFVPIAFGSTSIEYKLLILFGIVLVIGLFRMRGNGKRYRNESNDD